MVLAASLVFLLHGNVSVTCRGKHVGLNLGPKTQFWESSWQDTIKLASENLDRLGARLCLAVLHAASGHYGFQLLKCCKCPGSLAICCGYPCEHSS